MARREPVPLDCKVYVGELGNAGTRHELEDAFGYYGPLREVWVARNPPGFAFVMFQHPRDARDAVRALDGKIICGRRVRVELSTGKSRHEKGGDRYGSRSNGRSGFSRDARYGSPSPRGGSRYGGGGAGGGAGGGGRNNGDRGRYDDRYPGRHRGYSRSRSRSASPIIRGRPRTPPSRSRSHSPLAKSPRSDRYESNGAEHFSGSNGFGDHYD